jgi:hypothetical protein
MAELRSLRYKLSERFWFREHLKITYIVGITKVKILINDIANVWLKIMVSHKYISPIKVMRIYFKYISS